MKSRLTISLAGALAIWAASASTALAEDMGSTPENRMDATAARMVRGESYDQATRATASGSRSNVNYDVFATRMSALDSYDQAANAARKAAPEDADVVNSRWEKHLTAMTNLKAHEAGWAASTTN
jgi:hypothetical protein